MHVISICEVPISNVGHIPSTPEVFCVVCQFLKPTKMSQKQIDNICCGFLAQLIEALNFVTKIMLRIL